MAVMHRRFLTRSLCLPALVLLVACYAPTAAAQSNDDGSIYSRFGLGELRAFSSSQIQALGGGGTALWSYNYVNFGNPATWSHQAATRAALGARLDNLRATDAQDNSKRLTAGSLNAVQFSFPLLTDRLGTAFAFEPYSRVNYRVQTAGQLVTDPTAQDTSQYQINYEGTGGLQQIRAGAGYRLNDALSLGASVDVIFGIIEESRRTSFDRADFVQTNLATSTRLVGVTGTFGALLSRKELLGQDDELAVAASLTLPVGLESKRTLTLGQSLNRDTLGTQLEGTMDLPLSLRFGLAYATDNRWAFVADARYEPWSSFSSDLALPGYSPGAGSRFQDRLRLSAGVEVLPAGADLLDPYFRRVAYRLGFYFDQAYVTPVEGVDLNTLALTGGFSLPSVFAGTRLDINLEAGTRGTTDHNLVRDVFFGLTATLNVGERWFVKRKLR